MYTMKDVSKQLKIPVGTLKNWEKNFAQFFQVTRSKSGARIYGEVELLFIRKIKLMKDKNLSDDMVKFILATNDLSEPEIPEQIQSEYDLKYSDIVALQTETKQIVQKISDTIVEFKGEFINEVKNELTTEVKKEIKKGNSITSGIVQTYSDEVLDTYQKTSKQIRDLKQEVQKEQEEQLFLQKKVEEREELFQEFVQGYRQAAAALEEKKEKRKLSYWLGLLKTPANWPKL